MLESLDKKSNIRFVNTTTRKGKNLLNKIFIYVPNMV